MEQPYAGYFEDLKTGDELVSPARTVTEADVVAFAGISGDFNPLHTDAEYAKVGPFGARIAHGLLGLAIASGLGVKIRAIHEDKILAFLGLTWDYDKPVLIGDTIHIVKKVSRKRDAGPDSGLVLFEVALVNQRGERVQHGKWRVLFKKRPQVSIGNDIEHGLSILSY